MNRNISTKMLLMSGMIIVVAIILIGGAISGSDLIGAFIERTPTTSASERDEDNDGVSNADDACPYTSGTVDGCPDRDSDGIADLQDACPDEAGDENGCPSTDAVPTPNTVPTEVALQIVNTSGQELGDGVFRIYTSTNSVNRSETVRVELELFFEHFYITPTPSGQITRIPANTTSPSQITPSDNPTRTPIAISEPEQVFYQRMGASLICSPNSFVGCTETNPQIINVNGHRWTWILSPAENAEGIQNLEIEVWTMLQVNGDEERNTVWSEHFQLIVTSPDEESGISDGIIVAIIGAIGTILAAIIGVALKRQQSQVSEQPATTSKSTALHSELIDLKIFISYRRKDSAGWAKLIYDKLKSLFSKEAIFRDIEHINYGDDFRIRIKEEIWSSDVLIAVIGKDWFGQRKKDKDGTFRKQLLMDDDYVRQEIAAALERKIMVIPALVDDAKMPSTSDLPDDLKQLGYCNAVNIHADSSDDDINRLIRQLQENSQPRS